MSAQDFVLIYRRICIDEEAKCFVHKIMEVPLAATEKEAAILEGTLLWLHVQAERTRNEDVETGLMRGFVRLEDYRDSEPEVTDGHQVHKIVRVRIPKSNKEKRKNKNKM